MWFLVDLSSNEKASSEFFSQSNLAQIMKILPQTLNKALKEGRNKFRFRNRYVRVEQRKVSRFALFEFPETMRQEASSPIETFETAIEVAKWLNVTRQAVYAALNRGTENKIKNKAGKYFFLKKLNEKETPPTQTKV